MPATFESLTAMGDRLVRAGHNPMTPWWRGSLKPWYVHPTAKVFVARVGRGGVKSGSSVYIGTNETLNGDWPVPLGEIHYWAHVAENKTEAAERLRLYEACLAALGVQYERSGDAIIIPSLRRGIRVLACQIGSVSGFRCFGYCADEVAKWENSDHSANPAREVVASLDAMTITYPGARSLVISSPWGTDDLHYELFERGDNEFQITAYAPTWIANPAITYETCVKKAKGDQRILDREYRALAGLTVDAALDLADVTAAQGRTPIALKGACWMAIDASKLRHDSFAWMRGRCADTGVDVLQIGAFTPQDVAQFKRDGKLPTETVVEKISGVARENNVRIIFADDYESSGLAPLFRQQGIELLPYHWSVSSKEKAFSLLRRLLKDSMLTFRKHVGLFTQMTTCRAHLLPGGQTSYATNGLDFLSCVIAFCHAVNDNRIGLTASTPPASCPKPYIGPSYDMTPVGWDELDNPADRTDDYAFVSDWYKTVAPNRAIK